jgi:hypothetical protein
MKVRELIRELVGHAMDDVVYVGKGVGPLSRITSKDVGSGPVFAILSPADGSLDLSGIEGAARADERRKCAAEIRAAAKKLENFGMVALVRAASFDAADIIDPPAPTQGTEEQQR